MLNTQRAFVFMALSAV